MNKKVFKTLEYNKIIDMLVNEADSTMGKKSAASLLPATDINEIQALQTETSHALMRLFKQGTVGFHGLRDIRASLVPLDKGATLSISELLDISSLLDVAARAIAFDKKDEDLSDALSGRFHALVELRDLNREIKRCILSPEEISDDASPELKRIRRAIKNAGEQIHQQMTQTMTSSQTMLQENIITLRNGRYCLPVKAEYKSSFSGMIHGQSSSGSTFFIEPIAVVKLNNQLTELAVKEQEEIQKILAALSNLAAPDCEDLTRDVLLLAELDFIFAKAKLSKKMQASEPIFDGDYIDIKKGRHPLIPKEQVVPIDVALGRDYSLLIVTGPNTGGKTVSLKTVGLFTLMGQAGLHIPAFDHSHLRVYNEVYADIGDEQSIEQSLSTFSSHMTNTVSILERADENSLALFDELGAGTDPTEGAALAIAILNNLHERRVTAMATTHYSELKIYALSTDGVENASCEFDVESLRPTYRLMVGIPGKSNAFAISMKLGLGEDIIAQAEKLIDEDAKSFEDVVTDLEESRVALEQERTQIAVLRGEAEQLKKKLADKNQRIDDAKDKILRRANEEANDILQKAKDVADDSIRKYNKWMQGGGDTKAMEHQRDALREQLGKTGKNLTLTSSKKPKGKKPTNLKIGDLVMVHSMGVKGTVSTLPNSRGELFVQMGVIRSSVKVDDLELIQEDTLTVNKGKKQQTGSGKIRMSKAMSVTTEINLIGKTTDEAIPLLDKYLDDAYLSHLHQVTIIHGIGTGALKKAVVAHLKKTNYIKSFRAGEFGEGGYGVTIAEFKS